MKWLYRYEAKSIQRWVIGTGRLKEIAGGSGLLEGMKAKAKEKLIGMGMPPLKHLKLGAAGMATIEFDDETQLQNFASTWLLECSLTYPGLLVNHGWTSIATSGAATTDEWDKLFAELDKGRQQPLRQLPQPGPLVARAPRSGLPAVGRGTGTKLAGVLLDAAAQAQISAYQDEGEDDELFERCIDSAALRGPPRMRPIEKIEDFGDVEIAVIHADGNGIGSVFGHPKYTLAERKELSDGLQKCTEGAAKAAARTLVDKYNEYFRKDGVAVRKLPLRPIVLGGDDYTVIVRASDAVGFTELFLSEFAEQTRKTLGKFSDQKGFSACAGIAIVSRTFPFVQAHHLAEELCKEAKRSLRKTDENGKGCTPSGFMMHRVTTALLRSYQDIRREELSAKPLVAKTLGLDDKVQLSFVGALASAAWTVGDSTANSNSVSKLYELAVALNDAPRGAIREWLRLASTDAELAQMHWARMRDVAGLRGSPQLTKLFQALESFGCKEDSPGPWVLTPTGESSMRVWSPISDALALLRLSKGFPHSWVATTNDKAGVK